MTLPIIEEPLYGLIQLETAAWSSPFTWVDRTADLTDGIKYSEGGRVTEVGRSIVDVGSLTATFSNLDTVPVVGDLVRLRRYGTTEYAFTGYVHDVSQRVVFDQSESFTTPITLTTIYCQDWVGYISQFQAVGAGGADFTTGADLTNSEYNSYSRVAALNKIVDPTYATKIIKHTGTSLPSPYKIGDTDFVGSFAEHFNLISNSEGALWRGEHILPTNKTTGRTWLVFYGYAPAFITAQIFTDKAGGSGDLHYTEIDLINSSANISNQIILENRVRLNITEPEVTKIGGFNEENYMVINNTNVVGVGVDVVHSVSDATSITNYGVRQSVVQTNVATSISAPDAINLICNPSFEYGDDGYATSSTNILVSRAETLKEASPFSAYIGKWAMAMRLKASVNNQSIIYSGGESDGTPVVAGSTYYFTSQALRGTTSSTNARARTQIQWFNAAGTQIGATVFGSPYITLTTANTWYSIVSGAVVAPATAVRAKFGIEYSRPGAGFSSGENYYADALMVSKTTNSYFDGDTATTPTNVYAWAGAVGLSPSYKLTNYVDDIGEYLIVGNSTTSMRPNRIRWNAQEDLSKVSDLKVGTIIDLRYITNTPTYYRIVGIDADVDSERYMIDYYLTKHT